MPEAIELLVQVESERLPAARACAAAILAMALFRQGDLKESRDQLERARFLMEPYSTNDPRIGSWHDWLMGHLLLQEAEKLLASPLSGTAPEPR